MTETSVDDIADVEDENGLECLVLPIQAGQLLVPKQCMAEVAMVAPIFPDNSGPDWFLGHYSWRNKRVPLMSFEKLTKDQGGGINPNGRIAVFNNTGVNPEVQFIAIPTQGIPREVMIKEEEIESNVGNSKPGTYEKMYVMVGMEEMTIPDLSALEQAYCEFKDNLV